VKPLEPKGPNAEQITYWNEQSGQKWVELEALIDEQIADLGLAVMDRAKLAPGERVIDVGCGCGQTSLQLAERVGPGGSVIGIDISTVMLARAQERAAAYDLPQLRFENADAQTAALAALRADLVFSRFGVMFFADPPAAFANLRRALKPGGRLTFGCWQELKRNPWLLVPLLAAAEHVALPDPPAPDAPGPFALADPGRLRAILASAGFDTIGLEPCERELAVGGGGSLEQAVRFLVQLGPLGTVLRDADGPTRARATAAVREALAPFASHGAVRMKCAAWIVSAS
jgi:SAM-dependent methyltransferase